MNEALGYSRFAEASLFWKLSVIYWVLISLLRNVMEAVMVKAQVERVELWVLMMVVIAVLMFV